MAKKKPPKRKKDAFLNAKSKFLAASRRKHGAKYSYEKVEFKNKSSPVVVVCPTHGDFQVTPRNHRAGGGCPECKAEEKKAYADERARVRKLERYFHVDKELSWLRRKYGQFYKFTEFHAVCPHHGKFVVPVKRKGHQRRSRVRCPVCMSTEFTDWLSTAKLEWNDTYELETVRPCGDRSARISCKLHGWFKWRTGLARPHPVCPRCKGGRPEYYVRTFLREHCVPFTEHRMFDIIADDRPLLFDFCLTEWNVLIQRDGREHYSRAYCESRGWDFDLLQKHDEIRTRRCNELKIPLIRTRESSEGKIRKFLEKELDFWLCKGE